MDFCLSEELQALRKKTERFCARELTPETMTALDRSDHYPEGLHDRLAQEGFLKIGLPGSVAAGASPVMGAVVVAEVLAGHSGTLASIYLVNAVFGGACVALGGTAAQKAEILAALGDGNVKLAFALTEPEAGSDALSLKTTATANGGTLTINGAKLYTTGAMAADYIITVARTAPEAKASAGTGIILVPRGAAGLTVRPLRKLAGNAMASCEVIYDGVEVPIDNVIGGAAALTTGWGVLKFTGALERLTVAATCVGLANAVLGAATNFAKVRQQFGRPISQFQAIQHMLVEIATEIEAMRLLTYSAGAKADRGEMVAKEISMAKFYCAERVQEIVAKAMRIFGGSAYFETSPMARWYREAPLALYAGGTNEIQKNLVARLLGL